MASPEAERLRRRLKTRHRHDWEEVRSWQGHSLYWVCVSCGTRRTSPPPGFD